MTAEDSERLAALRAALELLAAPAREQQDHLDALEQAARETMGADPLEDPIDLSLHRRQLIPHAVLRQVEKIDLQLSHLLEEEREPFAFLVMQGSSRWREIRALARRGLMALGV